uniref:NR LBD domain-containing protein n=1 Tax=Acrobeloides nanus TaxID=290746 RepID=A0A914ED58_9BILA
MINQLMKPMRAIQVTEFEIAYMLVHMLWNVQEIGCLKTSTTKLGEEISELISHELHNYYIKEMCLTNYVQRVTKLIKMIESAKEIREEVKEITTMSRIFDLFHVETVGSGLIKDAGS